MLSSFISGIVIGFSIAAPVGPIGMLCIKRTLTAGRLCGLLTGLGAATADGAYGLIAAAGLSAVTAILLSAGSVLKVVGAAFLIWLGICSLRSAPKEEAIGASKIESTPLGAFGSSLLLTLTNPMTILSFIAILGTAAPITTPGIGAKALMVGGIFVGSCLWWITLTTIVSALKLTPSAGSRRVLNIASGLILIAFGVFALCSAAPASAQDYLDFEGPLRPQPLFNVPATPITSSSVDGEMRRQMRSIAQYLGLYVMRNNRFPVNDPEETNAARVQISQLVPTNPYALSGASSIPRDQTGAPAWGDPYSEDPLPTQLNRIRIQSDASVTQDTLATIAANLPSDLQAPPGTITIVGSPQGSFYIWGAGADGRPIKNPKTGRPLFVSFATVSGGSDYR